ncbi:hypothetical protein MRB53_024435 [Persea americana]|uniref:Uncharacterized protein n=1 Tax=Persea americana TaxID=3435 RepID=A0ACC2LDD3_PERAE|nr:hypothetical protein MRB53_024435 [Persea americana]
MPLVDSAEPSTVVGILLQKKAFLSDSPKKSEDKKHSKHRILKMVTADAARTIVGIAGNVTAFCLFISPAPTFYMIVRRRAVEKFSPIPYLATLLNCMLWLVYGLPFVTPNSVLVLTINGVGFGMEACYLCLFFAFASRKQRLNVLKFLVVEFAFVALVVVLVMTLVHVPSKRSLIVGSLCVIFGTCMYAAPLSVMKLVIQTKSVKYLPFYLCLANCVNGLFWTAYALLHFDIFILIPNGLGAIFGAVQLVLYGCYYRTTNWDDDEDDMHKSDLQLPTKSGGTM